VDAPETVGRDQQRIFHRAQRTMPGVSRPKLRERPAWQALEQHRQEIEGRHLRDLFAAEPDRGEQLVGEAEGVDLAYSKNRVTGTTLELLARLAEECGLRARIDAMFAGEHVNTTEDRAVLHVALRAPAGAPYARPEVLEVLDRMAAFCEQV